MQPTSQSTAGALQAHVLYLDVVGSSLRSTDDQRSMYNDLNEVVWTTPEYTLARQAGGVVSRPSGDGMALVFLGDNEAPVRCALEVAGKLNESGSLAVRMGIYSGEVHRVMDINGIEDVTGEGIVMARRVMDCGDAGHILISGASAEELERAPAWRESLHLMGTCSVKHGKRLALWNIYSEQLGNRNMPAIMVDQLAEEARQLSQIRRGAAPQPWVVAVLGIVLLAGALSSFLPVGFVLVLVAAAAAILYLVARAIRRPPGSR
jgi:class 3 adenylate cyclase